MQIRLIQWEILTRFSGLEIQLKSKDLQKRDLMRVKKKPKQKTPQKNPTSSQSHPAPHGCASAARGLLSAFLSLTLGRPHSEPGLTKTRPIHASLQKSYAQNFSYSSGSPVPGKVRAAVAAEKALQPAPSARYPAAFRSQ